MGGWNYLVVDLSGLADCAVKQVPKANHVVDGRRHKLVLQRGVNTGYVASMVRTHLLAREEVAALLLDGEREKCDIAFPASRHEPVASSGREKVHLGNLLLKF